MDILKEHFINGLNYDGMIVNVIYRHISISDTSVFMSEQIVAWVRRVEAWRAETTMLDGWKANKEFDTVHSKKAIQNEKQNQKSQSDQHPNIDASTADPANHLDSVWHMGRCAWNMGN